MLSSFDKYKLLFKLTNWFVLYEVPLWYSPTYSKGFKVLKPSIVWSNNPETLNNLPSNAVILFLFSCILFVFVWIAVSCCWSLVLILVISLKLSSVSCSNWVSLLFCSVSFALRELISLALFEILVFCVICSWLMFAMFWLICAISAAVVGSCGKEPKMVFLFKSIVLSTML